LIKIALWVKRGTQNLLNKIKNPIIIKIDPAKHCKRLGGIYLVINEPAQTAIKDEHINARLDPIKTGKGVSHCDDNNIVSI